MSSVGRRSPNFSLRLKHQLFFRRTAVLKTLIFLNKLDDGFLFLIEGLRVRGREVSVFLI